MSEHQASSSLSATSSAVVAFSPAAIRGRIVDEKMDSGVETGNDSNDSLSLVTHCENVGNRRVLRMSTSALQGNSFAIGPFLSISVDKQEGSSSGINRTYCHGVTACQPLSANALEGTSSEVGGHSTATNQEVIPNNSLVSLPDSGKLFSLMFLSGDKNQTFKLQFPSMSLHDSYPNQSPYICKMKPLLSRKNRWINSYVSLSRVKKLEEVEKLSMFKAAKMNNIKTMQVLLDGGLSPDTQDSQGRTALHLAASCGHAEMVKLLLSYGANPNLKDCIGNTPLHLAAVTSQMSVVNTLLAAGTDVLSPDCHGHNPLQLAQTRLRVLQNCRFSDMNKVKEEARDVIRMLLAHLQKQKDAREQVEALSTLCSRLSLSSTTDQVQDEVRSLLANVNSLSLSN